MATSALEYIEFITDQPNTTYQFVCTQTELEPTYSKYWSDMRFNKKGYTHFHYNKKEALSSYRNNYNKILKEYYDAEWDNAFELVITEKEPFHKINYWQVNKIKYFENTPLYINDFVAVYREPNIKTLVVGHLQELDRFIEIGQCGEWLKIICGVDEDVEYKYSTVGSGRCKSFVVGVYYIRYKVPASRKTEIKYPGMDNYDYKWNVDKPPKDYELSIISTLIEDENKDAYIMNCCLVRIDIDMLIKPDSKSVSYGYVTPHTNKKYQLDLKLYNMKVDKVRKQERELCKGLKERICKEEQDIKVTVWNTYIGESIVIHLCLCCKKTHIKNTHFVLGQVINEKNGGSLTDIKNLRPICGDCSRKMKISFNKNSYDDMVVFIHRNQYYF